MKMEKDIDSKISTFLKIAGIINNIFEPNKIRNNTRIKLYSTLALLCYYTAVRVGPLKPKIKPG
jgi:hypothetical protein